MTAPPRGYSGTGGVQWPSGNTGGYDVRSDPTWHGYDAYNGGKMPPQQGGYRAPAQRTDPATGQKQFTEATGRNTFGYSDQKGGIGGPGGGYGGSNPGSGNGGGSSGGGYYGGGGSGGTTPPGSTTPPAGTPGTATGPLFSKADTDKAVSHAAANAFSQGDAYSLKTAASGSGLSYGAGQASMISPLVSQAGVNARSAAKTIPLQDAMANETWMLGNQVQQGQNALDWARLGEYRNQTGQMNDDFFVKLLMGML